MNYFEKYKTPLSLILGIALSMFVFGVWWVNIQNLEMSLKDRVSDTDQLVVKQLQGVISDNVNRLKNLKRRLEITRGAYFDYWNKDAALIVEQDPSFRFIEWIDSTGVIQMVEPFENNEEAIGLDITSLDYRKADWNKARKDSVFNMTHWLKLVQGDNAFLIDAPVYIRDRFRGTITAGIDLTARFDEIMMGLEEYHIKIHDEKGNLFYTYGDSVGTANHEQYKITESIFIGDANQSVWEVTITPNQLFESANSMSGNVLTLVLALVLSSLVAISFFFIQKSSIAEKSHKQANKKLRSLIDSSPLAIFIINENGIVTDFWNRAAEEMFGWTRDEVIGNFIPFINDNDLDEFEQLMENCVKEGALKNQEVKRRRKDGSEGFFLLNVGMITGKEPQMLVLIEDITTVKQYQQKLQESLREKEFLLQEVHHRVKNNLAIIVGLIELQKNRIPNKKMGDQLRKTQNRIYSISGVHELLYKTENLAKISLVEYVDKLLNNLQETFQDTEKKVAISTKIHDFSLNINQAVPLGLLLNELITNSFKHAFSKTEKPEITLSIEESEGRIAISYHDNGTGLDQSDFESISSLGLNLIRTLLTQLEAKYELTNAGNGFGISFRFQIADKGSQSNM